MATIIKEMVVEYPDVFWRLTLPARLKFCRGGRGSAKSETMGRIILGRGQQRPLRILCAREIQKSIRDSVKKLLDDLIKMYEWDDFYISTNERIIGKNGTEIIFCGLKDATKIKSMQGIDICWVEEAQTVSHDSMELLIPTIRKEGSEIWFSYNPFDETDPVYIMDVLEPRPDSISIMANWCDNPWFPEVLRREMEWDKLHRPDIYDHKWMGAIRKVSEAQVFNGRWSVTDKMPKKPADWPMYYGADWGFSSDPSVLLAAWVDHDAKTIFIPHCIFGKGVETLELPEFFLSMPGVTEFSDIIADNDPRIINHLKYHSKPTFNIRPAVKGPGSVEAGVSWLRSYNIVVDVANRQLVEEFTNYSYKRNPRTEKLMPNKFEEGYDHGIDSLRYALEDLIRAEGTVQVGFI